MFTGLVEDVGVIERISGGTSGGKVLTVTTRLTGVAVGDSVALNGVCLTATSVHGERIQFDAGPETLSRTTTGALRPGSTVNLERALALGARLGGHLMQGHVDGLATLQTLQQRQNAYDLTIQAPPELLGMIAPRGSIAIDGISLTVTGVEGQNFSVSIIPHTWRVTSLADKTPGAAFNLEVDLIARYVFRMLEMRGPAQASGSERITEAFLAKHGF